MSKTKAPYQLGQPMEESFSKKSEKQIVDILEAVCYKKEEGSYTKNLTENELSAVKTDFAEVGLNIAKIEAEKAEAMEHFKELLKDPKYKQKELLETLKHRTVRKEGILYLMDDQEKNMMYKFDQDGICVDVRPMLQAEKQQVLRQLKAVNNG